RSALEFGQQLIVHGAGALVGFPAAQPSPVVIERGARLDRIELEPEADLCADVEIGRGEAIPGQPAAILELLIERIEYPRQ
ncbi:hypothetical protein, partial [Klebsiella pneumoniae]|uniref:hypothetical protein n=1 Tax=Klebsiella pneumoniae TaxID=573 RepID=UPI0027321ED2